jgi:hypothetical protein
MNLDQQALTQQLTCMNKYNNPLFVTSNNYRRIYMLYLHLL